MNRQRIAIFDFDGTLTTKDSFIEFAKFSVGRKSLVLGLVSNFLWLAAWKLRLIDGGSAKQRLFSSLFKGMRYREFKEYCNCFASRILDFERENIVNVLNSHINLHDQVFIVSASVPDWIIPWALTHGIRQQNVIGTEIEIDDKGLLTGKFSTPNCKGEEKVVRLKERVVDLSECEIFAYGDSSGDLRILEIADHPNYIC